MSLNEKPPIDELYDELIHYGMPRRSGRYPWGSGDDPYQHSGDYISRIEQLEKSGLTETEIASHFGMSTTEFRIERRAANNERKRLEAEKMQSMKDKGYSNYKIAEEFGINESSVRSKLKEHSVAKALQAKETSDFLKERIAEKGFVDISKDSEKYLNISEGKLDEAVHLLKMEGYSVYERYVDQPTNPGNKTTIKVLCPIDTDFETFMKTDLKDIHSVKDFTSCDDGKSFQPRNVYPKSMDSKRLQIRYADDAGPDGVKGIEKDGIIELRRGVDDLSLGNSRFAQVRILVDGDRYLKGMAVYSDDMPDGVDVIFNTNKTSDVPMRKVLKEIKDPEKYPDNPFGATIKDMDEGGQYYYTDKNGKKQLGLINKKSDEGDWSDWENALPSQFLSKQPLKLAKQQLNLAADEKLAEYKKICELTNPTVKKKLLEEFADDCDASAVHLKAAALPKQRYHVIIPIASLKDNEVYAPGYKDGTELALVRYPHGGTFEIPLVKVNNRNAVAKKILPGDVIDAIGINSNVAARLSGADFDGDTVMAIPTSDKVKIKSTPMTGEFKSLVGFDPKMDYATTKIGDDYINQQGVKIKTMSKGEVQQQMGRISNLITDMTLKGAPAEELVRAVKHSMVVIDAEKHKLDYKQSERDNNIAQLKKDYQRVIDPETGRYSEGASTLISRAKSQTSVPKRQGIPKINIKGKEGYDPTKPEGSLIYKTNDDLYYPERVKDKNNPDKRGFRLANGKTVTYDVNDKAAYDYYKPVKKKDENGDVYFTNKTGELVYKRAMKMQKSTKMAETDDARTLISENNTPMENLYADYANKMKSLANQARKEYATTQDIKQTKSAADAYANEVDSLDRKLYEAEKNSPKERRATLLADSEIAAKQKDNPDLTKSDLKKIRDQAMKRARETVGAKRVTIEIDDKEWEAIQAGAISKTKLKKILNYADMGKVREKAMPRPTKKLNTSQISNLKARHKTGKYTINELASFYGLSPATIKEYLEGKE